MKSYYLHDELVDDGAAAAGGGNVIKARGVGYAIKRDMSSRHFKMDESDQTVLSGYSLRPNRAHELTISLCQRKLTTCLNMKRRMNEVSETGLPGEGMFDISYYLPQDLTHTNPLP